MPCHSPGNVAPFALGTYAQVARRGGTIAEAVEQGIMPPWHASPLHGNFRNAKTLFAQQRTTIAEWVRSGCPEGEAEAHVPPTPTERPWAIGTPDATFATPEFDIPAEGTIEYQHFIVDTGFAEQMWVRAIEIRPGNRRVVHHCNVFLHPPFAASDEEVHESGALGSSNLIAFTPGSGPVQLPKGMAKRIPPGWRLHFIVHYTPIGSPQRDRTEIGLQFLPANLVRKEVATKLLQDLKMAIPPQTADHRIEQTWTADRDYLLLSMFPHMHLRGASFRYTAEYLDGTSEILLDVPRYDFNWQHRYELAEPKRLPAGTIIRCSAVYDNSKAKSAQSESIGNGSSGSAELG